MAARGFRAEAGACCCRRCVRRSSQRMATSWSGSQPQSAYTARGLWTCGFPVEALFCWCLRLWKSVGRAALKPFPKRLMQTRRRSRVADWHGPFERTRNRNVRVELPVPHEDVQAFDLLDQEQDRPAGRCNLCAWVVLESAAPSSQDVQFLRIKSRVGHAARLSPQAHPCMRVSRVPAPGACVYATRELRSCATEHLSKRFRRAFGKPR